MTNDKRREVAAKVRETMGSRAEPSERLREEVRRYDDGLSGTESLMSLRATELRRMVELAWPRGRANRESKPTTKADMAEWLIARMPAYRASWRVRFAEPVPAGDVEVKRRAEAAVAAHLAGRPCADEVVADG